MAIYAKSVYPGFVLLADSDKNLILVHEQYCRLQSACLCGRASGCTTPITVFRMMVALFGKEKIGVRRYAFDHLIDDLGGNKSYENTEVWKFTCSSGDTPISGFSNFPSSLIDELLRERKVDMSWVEDCKSSIGRDIDGVKAEEDMDRRALTREINALIAERESLPEKYSSKYATEQEKIREVEGAVPKVEKALSDLLASTD